MSVLFDRIPQKPGLPKVWAGTIISNPTHFSDLIEFVITDIDPTLKLGPSRWQARDAVSLPASGDDCLVIFDNDNEPWIVAWWPF